MESAGWPFTSLGVWEFVRLKEPDQIDEGPKEHVYITTADCGNWMVSRCNRLSGRKECNKNMAPRREPHPTPHDHQSHTGSQSSLDKDRHQEEDRHHPLDHIHPHPEHHPQKKAPLPPRHNPHTPPPVQVLDADHGNHQDRPRPAKSYRRKERRVQKSVKNNNPVYFFQKFPVPIR